jgi:hypothetical protein
VKAQSFEEFLALDCKVQRFGMSVFGVRGSPETRARADPAPTSVKRGWQYASDRYYLVAPDLDAKSRGWLAIQ